MTSMKILATTVGVTVALTLIGLQPSVAQARSGENPKGTPGGTPTSGTLNREQAVRTCMAQARQGRGKAVVPREHHLLYSACMTSKGLRP